MKDNKNIILGLVGLGTSLILLSKTAKTTSQPLLSGTYLGYGNIYSPEIDTQNNRMYFSGWYNDADYPRDAIYVTDLNNVKNVRKLLQFDYQIGDPTIIDNKMFMTFSPDPNDLTQHKIALSTTNDNGITWSYPSFIINQGWLPSAILTNNLYIYYTYADLITNQLRRATLDNINQITETLPTTFEEPNFYPINIDVKYYDKYYLLGDYWALINNIPSYCIGLWTSTDGINFIKYQNNPIIIPSNNNIIARTPYFIKEGNKLKIWYAQQKQDWWTNAIYYTEYLIG